MLKRTDLLTTQDQHDYIIGKMQRCRTAQMREIDRVAITNMARDFEMMRCALFGVKQSAGSSLLTLPTKKYRRRSTPAQIAALENLCHQLGNAEMLNGCKALQNVLRDLEGLTADRDRLLDNSIQLQQPRKKAA